MARSFNGAERAIPGSSISASTWTFSAWINLTTSSGITYGRIFAQASFNIDIATDWFDASGAIAVYDGSWHVLTSAISTNTWYHLAITYDGTNLKGYLNGTLGTSVAAGRALSGASSIADYQGHTGATDGNQWKGNLAEIAIFDTALSANEILALASAAPTEVSVKPKYYWPLDGFLSPEPDLSGNANNLTLTGTSAANHAPIEMYDGMVSHGAVVAGGGGGFFGSPLMAVRAGHQGW